jgi:hypothetical protein
MEYSSESSCGRVSTHSLIKLLISLLQIRELLSVSRYLVLRLIFIFTIKPTKVISMHYLNKPTTALLLLLPLSVVSLAAEPQNTAEPMQDMAKHQGMDMSKHQGMDMNKSQGTDMVKHQGMDMNKSKGADMGKHQGMGMGMMGDMSEEHLRSMQEHMLMMHDYSNKILSEKDPAKQAQLKNQQLELMKAHMAQMMRHGQQMKQDHK